MTGFEVIYEDAALARSLQLAADLEYAERTARKHRRKVAVRLRNSSSETNNNNNINKSSTGRTSTSRRFSLRRVPDPPATGVALERPDGPECDGIIVPPCTTRRGNNSSTRRTRRIEHQPLQPPPSTITSMMDPALEEMLTDGSSDEAKNKSLLYVPCEINDRLVEMMVDTGAQTSVISTPLMEKLCLDKKLNREKQGVAAGVGTARIIGRIENCPVQIGHACFSLYFAVLDIDTDMMILGIDQMRRFNCLVDLQSNKLIFGGKGGVEVDFFTQHQQQQQQSY